ncbi:MAG: CehA/McbA family metallohydrolase domain-containing protein [Planctomycetota bacterium]|jgi:hypothetical protein
MGDTHVHHRQEGLERVVDMAASHGCDFLAFAEHSFHTEYLEAQPDLMERAARTHPDMILVNGTEWSTPIGSDERSEQAGLMVPTGRDGMGLLREFLGKYDTKVAGIDPDEGAFLEALRWLGDRGEGDLRPLVILTHPHRRALETGPAVLGLCASSRPPEPGSLEVWPWSADVGGTCDQLFADGRRLVMLAESHFHKHVKEGGRAFWPGEFRRNYVFCPDRTEAGLFRGLRSGSSYFVLGDIVADLEFSASTDRASITMGESLTVPAGTTVEVALSFTENHPVDVVELIGNPGGDIQVVASVEGRDLSRGGGRARFTVALRTGGLPCYLRARGCARIEQPYPVTAWFYTNPLWLTASE